MKPFRKSIRWQMQVWHGFLLFAVLAAFGVTAYLLVRDNQLRRVDQQLQSRLAMVIRGLRPPPPPGLNTPRTSERFRLSAEQQSLFTGLDQAEFYYVLWSPSGEIADSSPNAPADVPRPVARDQGSPEDIFRTRGELRELTVMAPRGGGRPGRWAAESGGASAVVGYSLAPEHAELRQLAWLFTGLGGGVLGLGLLIGSLLSARAIRPIDDVTATAKRIAEGNLSERIDVADTENELSELSRVLNETFERLQAAFARQAQFTADAAHELRTPTFVILSQAQSALRRAATAAEYREGFQVCEHAAHQMQTLIEALLVLARQDAGKADVRREICRLDEITAQAVEWLRPLALEREISLRLELAPASLPGDDRQLQQVVTNLVSNAIEYNRAGGEVSVGVAEENGTAVLTVSDNGPGIAAEDLPHIFERFYRADTSRSSPEGHTGLGLAISKAVVEAHGGSLEASSQPGKGACFTARFSPGKNHRTA